MSENQHPTDWNQAVQWLSQGRLDELHDLPDNTTILEKADCIRQGWQLRRYRLTQEPAKPIRREPREFYICDCSNESHICVDKTEPSTQCDLCQIVHVREVLDTPQERCEAQSPATKDGWVKRQDGVPTFPCWAHCAEHNVTWFCTANKGAIFAPCWTHWQAATSDQKPAPPTEE
jgi:hypothetical protein